MKLSDYMAKMGLDDDAMAEKIGDCSSSGVKKWRRGERVPRPEHLRRIMNATGGLVTPGDFFALEATAFAQ